MAIDPSIYAQMNPLAFNQAQTASQAVTNQQAALPGIQAASQVAQQTAPLQVQNAKLDTAMKQVQVGRQLLLSATDQDTWDAGLKAAQAYGIPTDTFPKQYDPAAKAQMLNANLTAEDQINNLYKAQNLNLDKAKFKAEYPNAQGAANGGSLGAPAPTTPNALPTKAPLTAPTNIPQQSAADNSDGTINMPVKPIDGGADAVPLSTTPTQGSPINQQQPTAAGQTSLMQQPGAQQLASNDDFQPQYNAKGEPIKGVTEGSQVGMNSQGQRKDIIPQMNNIFNPSTPADLHGTGYLQTLAPTQAAYVKSVASGEIPIPTPRGKAESVQLEDLNAAVKQYDPTFYSGRKAALDSFRGGDDGKQIATFSKGIEHLDTLSQLTDQLNNTNSPTFNAIANEVSKQTGSPKVTNFNAAKGIVAKELDKAIAGAGGSTIAGTEDAQEQLEAANSPQQLKGAISTIQNLMGGQLTGLAQTYQNSVGGDGFSSLLTPKAAQVYQNYQAPAKTQSSGIPKGATATNSMGHKIQYDGAKWQPM